MKLKNTSDYPGPFLRRLIGWVRRQVKLPAARLRRVTIKGDRGCCSGVAEPWACTVRIGPAERFPSPPWRYHGAVVPGYADRLEALVATLAHELRHVVQFAEGRGRTSLTLREGECCAWERDVLAAFRAGRAALEAKWSAASPKPAECARKPRPSAVDLRATRASAGLVRWQKKLKLAQTMLRKYKRRVAYYSRRGGPFA